MKPTILIVEDDQSIRQGVELTLLKEGYQVLTAPSAEEGQRVLDASRVDLMILDLMLPGKSGFEFCRKLRSEGRMLPILMLTALADEAEKVLGFETGADDYVTKPFSLRELVVRIKALLRRADASEQQSLPEHVSFGAATVNFLSYTAEMNGSPVKLPAKALELLRVLVAEDGRAVSRDDLMDQVWGEDIMPSTRAVDNHVSMLRAALEKQASEPRFIVTVHGVGYRFDP